jgi:HSP20 family protein
MTDRKKNNKEDRSRRPESKDPTALALPQFGFPSILDEFMQRPFDEFMEPFFPRSTGPFWTEPRGRQPSIDFQDRGDHYLLTAELPGFDKKDIEVRIDSNRLELRAQKHTDKETEGKEGTLKQSSRSYVHRYMTLPEEVVPDKVDGTMKNGVLELELPKRTPKLSDKSRRVDLK